MALGIIQYYSPQHGSGYIRRDGWGDYSFEIRDVQGSHEVAEGQPVEFEVGKIWGNTGETGKPIGCRGTAVNVTILSPLPAGRLACHLRRFNSALRRLVSRSRWSGAGKFTQGWTDFVLKGENLVRIMGIALHHSGNAAPDLAFCIGTL
jgi:cold shock CspA family protein